MCMRTDSCSSNAKQTKSDGQTEHAKPVFFFFFFLVWIYVLDFVFILFVLEGFISCFQVDMKTTYYE